ncbi:sulfatase-like hydrolase/transferase [bacterium]|nr:sulfatase-like hydrolase/transferase [bacterium]
MNGKIEQLIMNGKYQEAWIAIAEYEKEYPLDADMDTYRFLCLNNAGEHQMALQYAYRAVQNQPYVADAHWNCGYAFELCENYFQAYEQYAVAKELALGGNPIGVPIEKIEESMQQILNIIMNRAQLGETDDIETDKRWINYIANMDRINWGIRRPVFHDGTNMIAQKYNDYPDLPEMFAGITGMQSAYHMICNNLYVNTIMEETDLQRTYAMGSNIEIESDTECFVPLIMNGSGRLCVQTEKKQAEIEYNSPLQYINYRVPKGKLLISSEDREFLLGEMVPIIHDRKRKPLILNIFVDGLSQTVLENHMEMLMPNTYRFFREGMICTNAHTAGDWTFPSIASIVTGQTMANHKMLHSKLLRKIDAETPILFEYFKNAGYNTTKIGGNWRIAPNYGYARGMNRVHYQHMYEGFPIEKVVSEVEEQIHTMRETDQFIWMEIGELHLIADEYNAAPLQEQFVIWENDNTKGKINSVKQEYDETKRKYYLKQIEYVDRKLAGLYQYIENNYEENEIVITLFADHGQGYLVRPEEEFLCDERTKIAFMTKGGEVSGKTEELISACDYTPIICKLAGIEYNYENTDASLPVVYGGEKEREFTVTESIHVGDPYQILLNGRDFTFYLKGIEKVTSECRVPLDTYEVKLSDKNGNILHDKEKINYYTKWCLDHIGSCRIYNN